KINRRDPVSVVVKEGLPCLRWSTSPRYHVLRDCRLGDVETELQKLAVDMRRPSRPREFRPEPLTDSGLDALASSGSCHRLKAAAFRFKHGRPPGSPHSPRRSAARGQARTE